MNPNNVVIKSTLPRSASSADKLNEIINQLQQKYHGRAIYTLAEIKKENGYEFAIEVDGGVTKDNVKDVTGAGAGIIVAGSAVFGAEDVTQRTREFVELIG